MINILLTVNLKVIRNLFCKNIKLDKNKNKKIKLLSRAFFKGIFFKFEFLNNFFFISRIFFNQVILSLVG